MPWTVLDPSLAAPAPIVTTGRPKTSVGATLQTLQVDLIRLMVNRSEVVGSTALQKKWVNQGYRHVASILGDIPQLRGSVSVTTIIGQPFYMLPVVAAGYEAMASIKHAGTIDTVNYLEGGTPLDPIDETIYRTLDESSDEPRCYFRFGEMLVLWPTPVAVRTIVLDGIIRPQDLVLATDSPILPPEFHEALPLAAKAKALRDLKEYSSAALAENDVVNNLRSQTDFQAEEKSHHYSRARPISSWRELKRGRR